MAATLIPRSDLADAALRELARRKVLEKGLTTQRSAEDQAVWESCKDLEHFAQEFFPHLCSDPFSSMHAEMFARDRANHGKRDLREATAAPRGSAKTTHRGFIKVIQDTVYGWERFTAIFSHTASLSSDRVKQIRDELETNQPLIRVYGRQVGPLWNHGDIITCHGIRVKAASPGSQLRGILQKGSRLTKILLDDFENPEHVLSELQRMKTSQRFFADIMKLGQPGTNVEIIGTILHPQSLLAGLLQNPGFTSYKYRAVLQFPTAEALPLWQEWRAIFVDLSNPQRQEEARAFYEAHEDVMLQGTQVLWPERESYYDLMVMRLVEGESAFWLEKQNDPLGDTAYLFHMQDAAYCTITPMGIVRAGGTLVPWTDIIAFCMAYDPTPPKDALRESDYAAVPVLAQDRTGYLYLVDTYLKREPSSEAQLQAIADLAWRWDCTLLSVEANGFASLLPANIRETIKARALQEQTPEFELLIVPLVNTRSKILRIKSLETLVQNGWLQFATTLPAEAMRQFAEFIPLEGAGHDDFPDSVEMAVRTIRHQWAKRDIT